MSRQLNHLVHSHLTHLVVAALLSCDLHRLMPRSASIMAKQSLQYTPLGPFMTMSGAIFVDRGNNARAIRSLEAAGETMKDHKVSLWMFPEGTRHSSEVPDMLPLKKGGFHLAIQAGIPIIPIVTENYWRMYRQGVFDTGKLKVRGTSDRHGISGDLSKRH